MSRFRRFLLVSVVACALFACPGCWSRIEIEQMSFVSMIGVDRATGGVYVTFQVVVPSALARGPGGTSAGQGPAVVVTGLRARTISEALREFGEMSPRQVRLKQLNAIVFGEELAAAGLAPYLDFFGRYWELRRSIWVLVARGQAREILEKGRPALERVPSTGVRFLLARRPVFTATRPMTRLGEFLGMLATTGREPLATMVALAPGREAAGEGSAGAGSIGAAAARGAEEKRELALRGAAAFRKDKLLGFLGPKEARGVLWVWGKVRGGITTVPLRGGESWATLVTTGARAKVRPYVTRQGFRFEVEVEETGYIC